MKNPIQPSGLFATPETMEELMAHHAQYSGSEKVAFTMGMMLTWNYLALEMENWVKANG